MSYPLQFGQIPGSQEDNYPDHFAWSPTMLPEPRFSLPVPHQQHQQHLPQCLPQYMPQYPSQYPPQHPPLGVYPQYHSSANPMNPTSYTRLQNQSGIVHNQSGIIPAVLLLPNVTPHRSRRTYSKAC
ncbi:hypothetical protein AOQ84DRAFT_171870 [Glonium stellatum]|uniref:Uncharacterized protein n=1 Tax=Glonium stellatum TaxID=574774 RepID=A0A8E2F7D0_9PEZI|nr:hypothetical protein AOQ84DRAFT_171870 [Glonium stellatum]